MFVYYKKDSGKIITTSSYQMNTNQELEVIEIQRLPASIFECIVDTTTKTIKTTS